MQAPDQFKKLAIPVLSMPAANQDFVQEPQARLDLLPEASRPAVTGWDPFEVWQRMIKEPRARRLAGLI